MTIEEEDDRPRRDITELMPIGLALILTGAAISLCFFTFKVSGDAPAPTPPSSQMQLAPGEVMIGVGAGSSIHPAPAPAKPGHP